MPYADPDQGREHSAEARREATRAKQDIRSQLGKVANPRRRKKAEKSFEFFARTYFPERFDKPFSEDHLKTIALIEQAVLRGGKLAVAMPRGSGKTTLIEVACIWALLIGARKFVVLVGSDKDSAIEMLDSIKSELETNELLLEDFPLEVGPFALLEGEARRCNGQRYAGERTYVQWKADRLVFATIKKSTAGGGVIRVAGITGRIRGSKYTRPDGKSVRPDLVVPDDPQTDESAASASQTDQREKILTKAIRGLAGPGKKILDPHALHGDRQGRPGGPRFRSPPASRLGRRAAEGPVQLPHGYEALGGVLPDLPRVAGTRRRRIRSHGVL